METEIFRAMNSQIVLAAEGERESLQAGFEATRRFIDSSEARFSRFLENSELSQLNRSAGSWFHASPELFEVIQVALQYVALTGGLFDPSILPALRRAGYDRSMDLIRANGAGPQIGDDILNKTDIRDIELDGEMNRIRLPAGMSIDLGGIAKGWIAERATEILAKNAGEGSACGVSAGGDMFLHGLPEGQPAWEIDLEDPYDPEQSLGVLRVQPGSVATSSIMKRRWRQGKRERHHLIDPRSGEPAQTPWLSVTVFAPHAAQAEVFAKALLIAGPQQAPQIAHQAPNIAFLAVDDQGKFWGSDNFQEVFNVKSESYA